jgi:DNA-binding GntR family transcriptional regulator
MAQKSISLIQFTELAQNHDLAKHPNYYPDLLRILKDLIKQGRLRRGDKMFDVPSLSDAIGMTRSTILKAYSILTEQNLVRSHKSGVYVV